MALTAKHIMIAAFCCCIINTNVAQSESDSHDVASLLAVIKTKPSMSDPLPAFEIKYKNLPPEQKYATYTALQEDYRLALQEHEKRLENAIDHLAAMGDPVVQTLLDEYKKKSHKDLDGEGLSQYRENIIRVLGKINTPCSQEIVLQIALGQIAELGPSPIAAEVYVDNLQIKSDAIPLLDNKYLQSCVLRRLKGAALDQALYEKCKTFLSSPDYGLRTRAAQVVCSDPQADWAWEKVNAIVRSLQTVADMPHAGRKFQTAWLGTTADNTYSELTRAMMGIAGLNASHIKPHMQTLEGGPRFCLEILLAGLKDASEKEALKIHIQDIHSGTVLRLMALDQFEKIMTEDDKVFLTGLSQNDPLLIYDLGGPLYEIVDSTFLVSPHLTFEGNGDESEKAIQSLIEEDIMQRGAAGRKNYIVRETAQTLLKKHFSVRDEN